MLCVSVSITMISSVLGVSPALNQETLELIDPDQIVQSWEWSGVGSVVGDIAAGINYLWGGYRLLFEGLLVVAANMECPQEILSALSILWRFIMSCFIISLIMGRRFMER